MLNPLLYCPECGVYFADHFTESPTCSFTLRWISDTEYGWMPKDQSNRGVASRTDATVFGLYKQ
jgi:hypothetical protein